MATTDYYPPQSGPLEKYEAWEPLKIAFDLIYEMRNRIATLEGDKSKIGLSRQEPNGPSNTKIVGLNVVGSPKNGQSLKYNGSTGQLEWS